MEIKNVFIVSSPYSSFLDKCSTYKIKNTIPEDTYLRMDKEYRDKGLNFGEIVESVFHWLEGKTLEELNDMRKKGARKLKEKEIGSLRVRNFAGYAKDKKRKAEMDKYEYFQKQNEENESKRADNMKKADERAREKARTDKPPPQEVCKVNESVLRWKENNPKRYHEGIKYMAKQSLEEHPSLGMLSHDKLKTIAVARLNTLLEKKITTK